MAKPIENFDDFVLDAFEPDDYPGDDAEVAVEGDGNAVPAPAREQWEIRDDGGADWAVRRVRAAEQAILDAQRLATEQIDQIRRYVGWVERRHGRDVDFFTEKLRRYYSEHVFPKMPKKGPFAHPLPAGKLKSSAGRVSVVVEDAEALRTWLAQRGHTQFRDVLAEPKPPEPVKAKLFDRFGHAIPESGAGEFEAKTASGAKVPGVKFVRPERSFGIEFEEGVQ